MSGWKGGGILLVLAIPLALYAAWQVKDVVRADMVVSDPPPDRGGTQEQLAATKAKTIAWTNDARKASTVALQYRQPDSGDTPGDASAADVVKTAAVRTADLNDLDLFLTRVENAKFTGKLKDDYTRWKTEADETLKRERAVLDRLTKPSAIASGADAAGEVAEVERLIAQYESASGWSSTRKAARLWRVRAQLKVIKALSALADAQYAPAMTVPLPLKADNNAMKTALETINAVKTHDLALTGAVKRAAEENVELSQTVGAELAERAKEVAKCSAREKLLVLFAREKLFTDAEGAAAWLKDVAALYRDADLADKRHIHNKVQEFCDAFLPPSVRLDDKVIFKKEEVQRENVVIEYEPVAGGGVRLVKLTVSTDADDLNEFNAAKRHPDKTAEVRHMGKAGYPSDLAPTDLSKAATTYNTARGVIAARVGGPKWTLKTVEALKSKCEAEKNLIDQLKLLHPKDAKAIDKNDDKALRLWVRMEGLHEGLKACADWIETAP